MVVEPLKDVFDRLVANYRCCPNVKPINLALHPVANKQLLYRVAPEKASGFPGWAIGISSFLPDHHRKAEIPSEAIVAVEVECVHLMELARRCSLAKLHLLQIDVEGFNAEVIRMIDFTRLRPAIIKFEHVNLQKTDLRDVLLRLKREDYQFLGKDLTRSPSPRT